MEMDAQDSLSEWRRDSSSSRSTLPYSALGHESAHELPVGQPLQHIGDKKYVALAPDSSQSASAAHVQHPSQDAPPGQRHPQPILQNAFVEQHPAADRNGRSTWESDRIVINTSASQDKGGFSHPLGQTHFAISQPSAVQGFGAAGHNSQRVMPFLRPGQQPPASSLSSNGQPQFVVPQTAPSMQGFQVAGQTRPMSAETLKSEGQMQLGQAGQLPYQITPPLFGRRPSGLQGQLMASPVPQMGNSFSTEKQSQVNPSEPLNRGQPHHQIHPLLPAIHPLPPNEQTQFSTASQSLPLQDASLGADLHRTSEPMKMVERPEIDALKGISGKPVGQRAAGGEQVAQLSSLTASLSQIFGNGQQLPQLYAALNPHHAPGLAARPFSHLAPLAAPPAVAEHGKAEISRMSPGLPSNPAEQQQNAAPPTGEAQKGKAEDPPKKTAAAATASDPAENSAAATTENGNSAAAATAAAQEKEKDGAAKKAKEGKGMRAFKCTLVEFVKEVLRPTWKEGQMSKEAHKTIVKKAVDKVVNALDGNVPHTKERIDLYMSYSKEKLTKLVQVKGSSSLTFTL